MSRRTRTLTVVAVIELLLAGGWFWLARMAAANPQSTDPNAQEVIGQTMGTAMGVIAGLAPALYLLARKNDRDAAR